MGDPLRVLLLSDDEQQARLVERVLKGEGQRIALRRVYTPPALQRELDAGHWDIILLTERLPGWGVLQALPIVYQRASETPIIVLTTPDHCALGLAAMRAGARDYVSETDLARLPAVVARETAEMQERRAHQLALEEQDKLIEEVRVHVEELTVSNEELDEARALVEAERQRYADLFEFAPDGYVVTDTEGVVQEVNQAMVGLTGLPREMIIGRLLALRLAHEERHRFLQLLSSLSAEDGEVRDWSTSLHPPDMPPIPVAINGAPIHDLQGRLVGFRWLVRDVTAQQEYEARLRALNETLEQRVAERTALAEHRAAQLRAMALDLTRSEEHERRRVAQLLHDNLQQIIAAAKLRINAVAQQTTEKRRHTLLEQADELLGESIELSRSLSSELSPPVLYDVGLGPALHWLARWMKLRYDLTVDAKVNDEPESVFLPDELRIFAFRAARELLFNVVKHSGVREASLALTYPEPGWMYIAVNDHGAGFELRRQDGEPLLGGLGLFGIRERVQYLGGRMELETAPGQGTSIALYLPLPEREEELTALIVAPRARIIRVALVGDHPIVRKGLVDLLGEQPGIEVVGEAADGAAAVELVRQNPPDVVIMDVNLPVMDGVEATRRIKKEFPQICVIGLSMYESAEMGASLREAGAIAFYNKGGPPDELIAAIRACMDGQKHAPG